MNKKFIFISTVVFSLLLPTNSSFAEEKKPNQKENEKSKDSKYEKKDKLENKKDSKNTKTNQEDDLETLLKTKKITQREYNYYINSYIKTRETILRNKREEVIQKLLNDKVITLKTAKSLQKTSGNLAIGKENSETVNFELSKITISKEEVIDMLINTLISNSSLSEEKAILLKKALLVSEIEIKNN